MNRLLNYFSIFFVLIGISTISVWSNTHLPLLNSGITVYRILWVCLLLLNYKIKGKTKVQLPKIDSILLQLYFFWLIVNIIRGIIFEVDTNYWIWKQLLDASFFLFIPSFIYAFSLPFVCQRCMDYWFKFCFLFFCIWLFLLNNFKSYGMWHFGLSPFLLFGCFAFSLPKKWKYITLLIIVIMITINIGSRSMVIKAFFAGFIAIGYLLKDYYHKKFINLFFIICYVVPCILLYLGISGTFNIFADTYESNTGKYTNVIVDENGNITEEDALTDTRTFIYEEVIESAVNNGYIIEGRTPARGNDSSYFGGSDLTGRNERPRNELCHLSIFTWLGIIGLILYSLFYFRASYLAVYKSNSIALKLLGCYVAFRWMYGWVEDAPSLQINNIALWMMIAMCISKKFREMKDIEFVYWLKTCFPHKK